MSLSQVVWPLRKPRMKGINLAVSTGYLAIAASNCYQVPKVFGVHTGWDINGPPAGDGDLGYEVQAVYGGTVVYSEWCRVMGNVVVVKMALTRANGIILNLYARYVHLKTRAVKVGDKVTREQLIGTLGKGDPAYHMSAHLHFDLWRADMGKADRWNAGLSGNAALEWVKANYYPPLAFFKEFGVPNIVHEGGCPL